MCEEPALHFNMEKMGDELDITGEGAGGEAGDTPKAKGAERDKKTDGAAGEEGGGGGGGGGGAAPEDCFTILKRHGKAQKEERKKKVKNKKIREVAVTDEESCKRFISEFVESMRRRTMLMADETGL